MKSIFKQMSIVLCVATVLSACATTSKPMPQEKVADLLATVPSETIGGRDEMASKFLRAGDTTIAALFMQVVSNGGAEDRAVRTALNGIAKYSSRPSAEKHRMTFENGALMALPKLGSVEAKAFTIRQLEVVGSDVSVELLGGFLGDEILAQPSITVLQLIGSDKATVTLDAALRTSKSVEIQIALVKALGDLRYTPAANTIGSFTTSENRILTFTAWYALANIGDISSKSALTVFVAASEGYDQTEAKSLLALYNRRRAGK